MEGPSNELMSGGAFNSSSLALECAGDDGAVIHSAEEVLKYSIPSVQRHFGAILDSIDNLNRQRSNGKDVTVDDEILRLITKANGGVHPSDAVATRLRRFFFTIVPELRKTEANHRRQRVAKVLGRMLDEVSARQLQVIDDGLTEAEDSARVGCPATSASAVADSDAAPGDQTSLAIPEIDTSSSPSIPHFRSMAPANLHSLGLLSEAKYSNQVATWNSRREVDKTFKDPYTHEQWFRARRAVETLYDYVRSRSDPFAEIRMLVERGFASQQQANAAKAMLEEFGCAPPSLDGVTPCNVVEFCCSRPNLLVEVDVKSDAARALNVEGSTPSSGKVKISLPALCDCALSSTGADSLSILVAFLSSEETAYYAKAVSRGETLRELEGNIIRRTKRREPKREILRRKAVEQRKEDSKRRAEAARANHEHHEAMRRDHQARVDAAAREELQAKEEKLEQKRQKKVESEKRRKLHAREKARVLEDAAALKKAATEYLRPGDVVNNMNVASDFERPCGLAAERAEESHSTGRYRAVATAAVMTAKLEYFVKRAVYKAANPKVPKQSRHTSSAKSPRDQARRDKRNRSQTVLGSRSRQRKLPQQSLHHLFQKKKRQQKRSQLARQNERAYYLQVMSDVAKLREAGARLLHPERGPTSDDDEQILHLVARTLTGTEHPFRAKVSARVSSVMEQLTQIVGVRPTCLMLRRASLPEDSTLQEVGVEDGNVLHFVLHLSAEGGKLMSKKSKEQKRQKQERADAKLARSLQAQFEERDDQERDNQLEVESLARLAQQLPLWTVGLNNVGNSCYFATVFQCLARCTPLLEYLISGDYLEDLDARGSEGSLIKAVAAFLSRMISHASSGSSDSAICPGDLKRIVSSRLDFGRRATQEDAHELLVRLLDGCGEKIATTVRFDPDNVPFAGSTLECVATANHVGSRDTGHYTARVRSHNNLCWYEMDDRRVSHIGANAEIVDSSTYFFILKASGDNWRVPSAIVTDSSSNSADTSSDENSSVSCNGPSGKHLPSLGGASASNDAVSGVGSIGSFDGAAARNDAVSGVGSSALSGVGSIGSFDGASARNDAVSGVGSIGSFDGASARNDAVSKKSSSNKRKRSGGKGGGKKKRSKSKSAPKSTRANKRPRRAAAAPSDSIEWREKKTLPFYSEKLCKHPNSDVAKFCKLWNKFLTQASKLFRPKSMPIFAYPLPPDNLDSIKATDSFIILLLHYSPLALHTNAIGRKNSAEETDDDGNLVSETWKYVKCCLGAYFYSRCFRMDAELVAYPYQGKLEDIMTDANAQKLKALQKKFLRAVLKLPKARIAILGLGAMRKVEAAFGGKQKLNKYHRANRGHFLTAKGNEVSAAYHPETIHNKEFRDPDTFRSLCVTNDGIYTALREVMAAMLCVSFTPCTADVDLIYTALREVMAKMLRVSPTRCTVNIDLCDGEETPETALLADLAYDGTKQYLKDNANSEMSLYDDSVPAGVQHYAKRHEVDLLKYHKGKGNKLESLEDAQLWHLQRFMSHRGGAKTQKRNRDAQDAVDRDDADDGQQKRVKKWKEDCSRSGTIGGTETQKRNRDAQDAVDRDDADDGQQKRVKKWKEDCSRSGTIGGTETQKRNRDAQDAVDRDDADDDQRTRAKEWKEGCSRSGTIGGTETQKRNRDAQDAVDRDDADDDQRTRAKEWKEGCSRGGIEKNKRDRKAREAVVRGKATTKQQKRAEKEKDAKSRAGTNSIKAQGGGVAVARRLGEDRKRKKFAQFYVGETKGRLHCVNCSKGRKGINVPCGATQEKYSFPMSEEYWLQHRYRAGKYKTSLRTWRCEDCKDGKGENLTHTNFEWREKNRDYGDEPDI
ncbi:hypothetical protein ACHAXT_002141 [Thalassiosira profunda]